MRQRSYKLALTAMAFCILATHPGCVGVKKGSELFSVPTKGGELPFMPEGLFCTPDDLGPGTNEVYSPEQSCSAPPAVPCRARPARVCSGRRDGGMVEPMPLVDTRQTRSRFHAVPTRPVFLPQPNRDMMGLSTPDRPDTVPTYSDQMGSPQIEMILPEQPPEALPTPPTKDAEDRVASKPSWIFRTSANRPPSAVGDSLLTADSTARPLRR